MKLKGVILAAGEGVRLRPLTKIANKQLLPIYNKPMIDYAIEKLNEVGIKDIAVVVDDKGYDLISNYLGKSYTYLVQDYSKGKGIAKAIQTAKEFIGESDFIVHLGDQVYEDSLVDFVKRFKEDKATRILLKWNPNAREHTVATTQDNNLVDLIEKPDVDAGYTMIGVYAFTPEIFDYLDRIKLSDRNEYEICDAIKMQLKEQTVGFDELKGPWFDTGTFENIFKATEWSRRNLE